MSNAAGGAGVGSSAAEHAGIAATVGSNSKLYSSGWHGNQYVNTMSVSEIAGKVGIAGAVVSTMIDFAAWQQGDISGARFALNTGVNVIGTLGPFGAAAAAGYYAYGFYNPNGIDNLLSRLGAAPARNACPVSH